MDIFQIYFHEEENSGDLYQRPKQKTSFLVKIQRLSVWDLNWMIKTKNAQNLLRKGVAYENGSGAGLAKTIR